MQNFGNAELRMENGKLWDLRSAFIAGLVSAELKSDAAEVNALIGDGALDVPLAFP